MEDWELREKLDEAYKENKMVLVRSRYSTEPDVEGLKKILQRHKEICNIRITRLVAFSKNLYKESFYAIPSDKELSRVGRKKIEEQFLK